MSHQSQNPFKWRHFETDIILLCVRWYLRYALSYRDLEEMMLERGLSVDHTTIYRWVQHYAPKLEKRCRPHLKAIAELKAAGIIPEHCELRQVKYLNNLIEQDHRFIKRLTKPGMGFFSFETAWRTLQGFEVMNMLRKGQVQGVNKGDARGQVAFRWRQCRCHVPRSSRTGRVNLMCATGPLQSMSISVSQWPHIPHCARDHGCDLATVPTRCGRVHHHGPEASVRMLLAEYQNRTSLLGGTPCSTRWGSRQSH